MVSRSLEAVDIPFELNTSASPCDDGSEYQVHITHLYYESYMDYHDPVIVAVRDPLDMIASWHHRLESVDDPDNLKRIWPARTDDCFRIWMERDLPWFRIEDQFYKLGEFLGKLVPQTYYAPGKYWVRELIEQRDRETLWKVLPLDFLAEWVECIPAYQTYDLWWI